MSSHNYIAMLGRQPELALVELESLLGSAAIQPFGRQAALLERPLDVAGLGGVIRVAQVLYMGPAVDAAQLPIDADILPLRGGKTPFAVSLFGLKATRRYAEVVGLALKKRLKVRGSVRLIQPRSGLEVSAAGLKHNDVLTKGFELLVVVAGQQMVVAQTLSVQDVDEYAERDYGRPARSAKVGMLPPKLAQILINTTSGGLVADPFCGTGVVLQEARLLGRPAYGSDLSAEMVAATQENMAWLDLRHHNLPGWSVQSADARSCRLPALCAVVTEGYLGPHLTAAPPPARLRSIKQELHNLYLESLANWAGQLGEGSQLAVCVPAWRVAGRWEYLDIVDELPHLGYTLRSFAHATTPLLYARSNQVVGRQLLLLRKN